MGRIENDDIYRIMAIRPEKSYINNTKVMQMITDTLVESENGKHQISFACITIPKTKKMKDDIEVDVVITVDEGIERITLYDKAVLDSIYTIYVHGNAKFTDSDVLKLMTGKFDIDATKGKLSDVKDSIRKLCSALCEIDFSEELRLRNKPEEAKNGRRADTLLPLDNINVKQANGTETRGYELKRCPLLFQYAEYISQIINFETSLLRTASESMSETNEVIILKRYLISRIASMKNSKNHLISKRISYEWYDAKYHETRGLLTLLGISQDDAKKRSKIHSNVKKILDRLKAAKYIKGYSEVREVQSHKIKGVDIEL